MTTRNEDQAAFDVNDHDGDSDEDLYMKMIMLYQEKSPQAWDIAQELADRGTLEDEDKVKHIQHVLSEPKPEERDPTKAEALLSRLSELGYADAERSQLKGLRDQEAQVKDKVDQKKAQKEAEKDPVRKKQLKAEEDQLYVQMAQIRAKIETARQLIGRKYAAAGKRPT